MQCPGFSSGVSPGNAGSLPKCNQYINTRPQYPLEPLAVLPNKSTMQCPWYPLVFLLEELNENLKGVITLLLEDGEPRLETEFIGTQNVVVA